MKRIPSQQRVLGIFTLAMINVAAIVSLRNLPLMAMQGWASVFYYAIAAFTFLIPSALVCAELASGWSKSGGLYIWVKEAFGPRWGFFAMWAEWMLTTSFFPTLLSFAVGTLAYLIDPALARNPIFMVSGVVGLFWFATALNLLGMRVSGAVSTIGVLLGTIIPGCMLIGMGCILYWNDPLILPFTKEALLPDLGLGNMVFLVGVMLGFEGMELTAFHVNEVKDPQRTFPIALFLATIIILVLSVLGSLSLAFVVPPQDIRLIDGIMQIFSAFFNALPNQSILGVGVKTFAVGIFLGSFAGLTTWVAGPIKGVLACAEDGFIPHWLQYTNKKGAPVSALILQAIYTTILASCFVLMPSLEHAYWFLTILASLFALTMFILIYLSVLRLRYTQSHVKRAFCIPGGKAGVWIVCGVGILSALFSILISFVPPDNMTMPIWEYAVLLIGVFIVLALPAAVLRRRIHR